MAMISAVENVVVEQKKLFTHQEMLDGVSLASKLPDLNFNAIAL